MSLWRAGVILLGAFGSLGLSVASLSLLLFVVFFARLGCLSLSVWLSLVLLWSLASPGSPLDHFLANLGACVACSVNFLPSLGDLGGVGVLV